MSDKELLAAIDRGDAEAARAALDAGAKAASLAPDGEPLLARAAAAGHEAVVALLLARGVDANVAGDTGNTALMHAAARGHSGVVRLLLERGADPGRKNRWGQAAEQWAKWPANGPEVQGALQDAPKR
ncbi:MAG: ankyrin repeat domain-containing protein [Rhodospirillales bacterium]